MKAWAVYWEFVKIKFRDYTENRIALFSLSFSKLSNWLVDLILIWILITTFQTISGWTAYEVILLYGLNLTSYSFAGFFLFHPFTKLAARVRTGEFDEVLTKPMNPFLYMISREFSAGYFSNLITGSIVIAICFVELQLKFNVFSFAFLLFCLIGGAFIQGAGFVFAGTPAFWLVQNQALNNLIIDSAELTRYPISIYPVGIQVLLTFIFPYSFINFYPAQFFLDKNDFLIFHPMFQFLTPLVGGVLFFFSYQFWKMGLRYYESTGS